MIPQGGRGVLMGGVGGVRNAKVVVLGGGVAGQNAASVAVGMGADVTVLDTDLTKLRELMWHLPGVEGLMLDRTVGPRAGAVQADLVIGTVLVPGAKAPKLVTNEMVAHMKPGSVLVDVAIDQGGCFEDSRPTTHDDPTFQVHKSTFYCVANMPGAVSQFPDLDLGAHQRDAPLRAGAGRPRVARGAGVRPVVREGPQHPRRAGHQRGGRVGARFRPHPRRRRSALTTRACIHRPCATTDRRPVRPSGVTCGRPCGRRITDL